MRQTFLLVIVGIILVSLVVGALYMVLRSILDVFDNWQTNRELKELQEETVERQQTEQREHAERLENGCDHQWGGSLVGFPPQACARCGLEKTRPRGACDHVWRVEMSEVPMAVCEICGAEFRRPSTVL